MLTFAARPPVGDRAALPRARPRPRLPGAALGPVGGGSIPLPAALGALLSIGAWVSVIVCTRARAWWAASGWLSGVAAVRRLPRAARASRCTKRFTIPAEALPGGRRRRSTAASSCPSSASASTTRSSAPRAGSRPSTRDEGEGGAVLEALYVFEIPMSLPIDAARARGARGRGEARARAGQGGGGGVRGRGGGHGDGARTHGRARRSSARRAGAGWRRSCSRAEEPTRVTRRGDPRRPRPGARPLRRRDHPLRRGKGPLQGDPHRAARRARRALAKGCCP